VVLDVPLVPLDEVRQNEEPGFLLVVLAALDHLVVSRADSHAVHRHPH